MDIAAFEATASDGNERSLDEVLNLVDDDLKRPASRERQYPPANQADMLQILAFYALLKHVFRLAVLVFTLFLCAVLYIFVLSWTALFWFQTRLFFATSSTLKCCMNEPEQVTSAEDRAVTLHVKHRNPAGPSHEQQKKVVLPVQSETDDKLAAPEHDSPEDIRYPTEDYYQNGRVSRSEVPQTYRNDSNETARTRSKDDVVDEDFEQDTGLDKIQVRPDEALETFSSAQPSLSRRQTRPESQKQSALSKVEQRAQAQTAWLDGLASSSTEGQRDRSSPNAHARAITERTARASSKFPSFSAEQLTEARNFAFEATRGGAKAKKIKAKHYKPPKQSYSARPGKTQPVMLHAKNVVAGPSRAVAIPCQNHTMSPIIHDTGSSRTTKPTSCVVPPHIRAAMEDKTHNTSSDDTSPATQSPSTVSSIAGKLPSTVLLPLKADNLQSLNTGMALGEGLEGNTKTPNAVNLAADDLPDDGIEETAQVDVEHLGSYNNAPSFEAPHALTMSVESLKAMQASPAAETSKNILRALHTAEKEGDFQGVKNCEAHTELVGLEFAHESSMLTSSLESVRASTSIGKIVKPEEQILRKQQTVATPPGLGDTLPARQDIFDTLLAGNTKSTSEAAMGPPTKERSTVPEAVSPTSKSVIDLATPSHPSGIRQDPPTSDLRPHSNGLHFGDAGFYFDGGSPSISPSSSVLTSFVQNPSVPLPSTWPFDIPPLSNAQSSSPPGDCLKTFFRSLDTPRSVTSGSDEDQAGMIPTNDIMQTTSHFIGDKNISVEEDKREGSSKTIESKRMLKQQKMAARDALKEAWINREDARSKLVGTWTCERAEKLMETTASYHEQRESLRALMNGGQLNDDDAKVFPSFARLELSEPRYRPDGIAETRQRMTAAGAENNIVAAAPSNIPSLVNNIATGQVSMRAYETTPEATLVAARKLRQEALEYFKQPRPQSNISYRTWKERGVAKLNRANAYYSNKRRAFEAALPNGWTPELLKEFPEIVD